MLLNEGVKTCVSDREKRILECVGLSPDVMLSIRSRVTLGKALPVLVSSACKKVHHLYLAVFCEVGNNYIIKC